MDTNTSNTHVSSNPLDDETHSPPPQEILLHEKKNANTNTNDSNASKTTSTPHDSFQESMNDSNISPTFELSNPNLGHVSRESRDGNIPTSSHEHSNDISGQNSPSISSGQSIEKGSEIQNPQIQVMERPSESNATSPYVFPSHVFARNNTNGPVEWSTASNESLFSIYMGNMSFSSELACFKSCEMDKPMCDQPNASPNNNQPPTPVNKFNDISQRTAELHEEAGLKATEAKAAETMREVIMESSQTTENVDKKSSSQCHSDGSAKSYAFQTSKGRDKSVSSKGAGEKQTPHKKSEQNEKTKLVVDEEEPKSNTDAAPNKWLNCFSCCTFCH